METSKTNKFKVYNAMKTTLIIEDGDNGMTVLDEDNILTVIENTHSKNGVGKGNLFKCLGKIFHGLIIQEMDGVPTNRVRVTLDISEEKK